LSFCTFWSWIGRSFLAYIQSTTHSACWTSSQGPVRLHERDCAEYVMRTMTSWIDADLHISITVQASKQLRVPVSLLATVRCSTAGHCHNLRMWRVTVVFWIALAINAFFHAYLLRGLLMRSSNHLRKHDYSCSSCPWSPTQY